MSLKPGGSPLWRGAGGAPSECKVYVGAAASLEITGLVREADDAAGLGDVDPARLGPEGVERDAERAVETRGKHLVHLRLSDPVLRAQNAYAPGTALGQKDVPIGSCSDQTRILQAGLELFNLESQRSARPGTGGDRHAPPAPGRG